MLMHFELTALFGAMDTFAGLMVINCSLVLFLCVSIMFCEALEVHPSETSLEVEAVVDSSVVYGLVLILVLS